MVSCTQCNTPFGKEMINTHRMTTCPACKTSLRADVFPAMFRAFPGGAPGETLLQEKEASCFYHPLKKAVIVCSVCGRFLCALCDVEFNDMHLCPSCLEKGRTKRKIRNLEDHRTCYDKIALLMAIVPMLGFWITILTAPAVLFITISKWNAPASIVRKSRIRFIAAFLIASLQIMGWTFLFVGIIL